MNPSLKVAAEALLPPFLLEDLEGGADEVGSEKARVAWEGMGKKMYHKLASRAQVHGVDVTRPTFARDYMKAVLDFHLDAREFEECAVPIVMLATEEDTVAGSGGAEVGFDCASYLWLCLFSFSLSLSLSRSLSLSLSLALSLFLFLFLSPSPILLSP